MSLGGRLRHMTQKSALDKLCLVGARCHEGYPGSMDPEVKTLELRHTDQKVQELIHAGLEDYPHDDDGL